MQCPICKDRTHAEKISVVIEDHPVYWCSECDQYFLVLRWWKADKTMRRFYTALLLSVESVEASQDATD